MQLIYNQKSISIFQFLPYFHLLLKIYKTYWLIIVAVGLEQQAATKKNYLKLFNLTIHKLNYI
jgi:hypothetical protein